MNTTKRRLIIIGALVLISVIVGVIIYFSQKKSISVPIPLEITGSVPANGTTEVSVFDPITVTFNQTVNSPTITVVSDPPENWTVSQATGKSITIGHKLYLKVATTYQLTILQHGNSVGSIAFETAHEQNDPRQLQTLQSELNKDYPLASLTPYETSKYRVVYSAPLTLEIDLKNPMNSDEAISQVQAWVRSNGVDPATHKYIVVAPTSSP